MSNLKICIDAGHNYSGWDTGAEGHGLREQDITYPIAFKLKTLFESIGITVIMTRNTLRENLGTSYNSALTRRAEISNENSCDYFISIHCNAHPNQTASGTEVLVYKFGGEAQKIANSVQKELIRSMGTKDRGVKEQNVCVLRKTVCPAILVETAFITNKNDNALLRDNQDGFAKAIFLGFCNYLGISCKSEPVKDKNTVQELSSINDIVWELEYRGIITNKDLWLKKLEEDTNAYWLARKTVNYLVRL